MEQRLGAGEFGGLNSREVQSRKKQVIALIGGEGGGKSTQAGLLGQRYNLPVFGMGPEFRDLAANDKTELGDVCREMLRKHEYSKEELYWSVFNNLFTEERLRERDLRNGFVMEGAFRHIWEVEHLKKRIENRLGDVNFTIFFLRSPLYQSAARFIKREIALAGITEEEIRKMDGNAFEKEKLDVLVRENLAALVDRHRLFYNDPDNRLGPRISLIEKKGLRLIQINTANKSIEEVHGEIARRYEEAKVN